MESPPSEIDEPSEPESYRRGRKAAPGLVAAAALVAAASYAFVRYRPARVAIEGVSMVPTLVPGDWVLVVTQERYERGDVVVVEHPQRSGYEVVKRITGAPGDVVADRKLGPDEYWVQGDYAPRSTDSRAFGPVSAGNLKAKAVLIYWPIDRRQVVH